MHECDIEPTTRIVRRSHARRGVCRTGVTFTQRRLSNGQGAQHSTAQHASLLVRRTAQNSEARREPLLGVRSAVPVALLAARTMLCCAVSCCVTVNGNVPSRRRAGGRCQFPACAEATSATAAAPAAPSTTVPPVQSVPRGIGYTKHMQQCVTTLLGTGGGPASCVWLAEGVVPGA